MNLGRLSINQPILAMVLSIVLLIVWVYYSGQVFFLGAEFTKVFADRYGSQPSQHLDPMVVEKANPSPQSQEGVKIIPPGAK